VRLMSKTDLRWVRGVWARAGLRGLCWVREGVVKWGDWLGLVKSKGYQALQYSACLFYFGLGIIMVTIVHGWEVLHTCNSCNSREFVLAWKEAVIGFEVVG
jgi:hypothetical protein